MIEFANLPDAEREIYFQETAERSRLPAHLVEKDFWVCYTLRLLFSDAEIARYLTFKGGTSLSKVYKAIDRFSEDIDFAVSRESLGFTAAAAPDAASISMEERKRRLARLSDSCRTWTTESLFPKVGQALTNSLSTNRWSVDLVADDIESTIADDYLAMQEMIFGAAPNFEQILSTLRGLKERISSL